MQRNQRDLPNLALRPVSTAVVTITGEIGSTTTDTDNLRHGLERFVVENVAAFQEESRKPAATERSAFDPDWRVI